MQPTINYSVSPYLLDHNNTKWAEFENLLQTKASLSLHFKDYASTHVFKNDLSDGNLGLIYADPYHASILLRNYGYWPVARAMGQYDEAVVAVQADSSLMDIQDIKPKMYLSISVEPINRLLARLLLQPADINEDDMVCRYHRTQKSVVRDLLLDKTDVGVMSSSYFDRLQPTIKSKFRILVRSQTYLFSSLWMLSPDSAEQYTAIARAFHRMHKNRLGSKILKTFHTHSWLQVEQIKAEEMADLLNMIR